ncbi:MAG TPA: sigma factor-like helix-turn-helix DNA-binding protein, partial [Longimicrobiaceae bacterium]|nr:sigma factor-like helix-turn-helix DNA-binding protein [Longimicrobiaceae bacterium]
AGTLAGASADLPARGDGADLRLDLERAVAALPGGARDVFVLYDVEGFSHGEIAATLGMGESTSRSQLARARMLLRHHLSG